MHERIVFVLVLSEPSWLRGMLPAMIKLAQKTYFTRGLYKSAFWRWWLRFFLPPETRHCLRPVEPYEDWKRVNRWTRSAERDLRLALAEQRDNLPTVSVLMPVHKPPLHLLEDAIRSVREQLFESWQLVIVDDASNDEVLHDALQSFADGDSRILYRRHDTNSGISATTNAAFALSTGNVILFMDNDDLLSPDCLAEIALNFAEYPECDIAYSDHDKINGAGDRISPQFKPSWSPALLLSYMYLGHVVAVRRDLFERLDGLRSVFDGSQDYDFALRAAELAREVRHIPKMLYHWRMVPGSTAVSGAAKPNSFVAGKNAVLAALDRRGVVADVHRPHWAEHRGLGLFGLRFPDEGRSIDIIIPVREAAQAAQIVRALCASSHRTALFTFVGADSAILDDTMALIDGQTIPWPIRLLVEPGVSSMSDLCNAGAKSSGADALLFAITPLVPDSARWIDQLLGYLELDDVGAVGARQLGDGQVASAGLVLPHRQWFEAFAGERPDRPGALYLARVPHECEGLTANGLMARRKVFNRVGGFLSCLDDPVEMGLSLCRGLRAQGRSAIVCANVDVTVGASTRFHSIADYGSPADSHYNPNLTWEAPLFLPAARCPSLRADRPLRVLFMTHSLEREGAPIVLFDLIHGLVTAGAVEASVISPCDGPLAARYREAGIDVEIVEMPRLRDGAVALEAGIDRIAACIRDFDAELVFANTLEATIAVNASVRCELGAVLWHHEAYGWAQWLRRYPPVVRAHAAAALGQAYRVIFVAEATRRKWLPMLVRPSSCVVRHALPPSSLTTQLTRWTRDAARAALAIGKQEMCVLMLGSICERKGQIDLIQAIAALPAEERALVRCYIVGASVQKRYKKRFQRALAALKSDTRSHITVVDAVEDVALFYRAADILVCCSRAESAPRVILEAMSFGLPIVTTPVDGIPEMVANSALFYKPANIGMLTKLLRQLLASSALRNQLGLQAQMQAEQSGGYDEMITRFVTIMREAARTSNAAWLALPEQGE